MTITPTSWDIPSVAQVHLWECHFFLLNTGTREREKDNRQGEIIDSIYAFAPGVPDMQLFAVTPPMIPGYGMGSGFELYLQDKVSGDLNKFKEVADNFVATLNERPEIEMAYSSFETNYPQYWVDIDAAKCRTSRYFHY